MALETKKIQIGGAEVEIKQLSGKAFLKMMKDKETEPEHTLKYCVVSPVIDDAFLENLPALELNKLFDEINKLNGWENKGGFLPKPGD